MNARIRAALHSARERATVIFTAVASAISRVFSRPRRIAARAWPLIKSWVLQHLAELLIASIIVNCLIGWQVGEQYRKVQNESQTIDRQNDTIRKQQSAIAAQQSQIAAQQAQIVAFEAKFQRVYECQERRRTAATNVNEAWIDGLFGIEIAWPQYRNDQNAWHADRIGVYKTRDRAHKLVERTYHC